MDRLSGIPFASRVSSKLKRLRSKSATAICLISETSLMSGRQSASSLKAASQPTLPKKKGSLAKPAVLIDDATNLYQVDYLLFRSEQLRAEDIPLLKSNDIDAILNLRIFGQRSNHKLLNHITDNMNVSLHNYPLKTWYVTPQEVAKALIQIRVLKMQNKRVLVHCYHGSNRTGLIIAMYRIIEQDWSIEQAKLEMVTGDFGYHPMWVNLRAMLNSATVAEVRAQM